MNELYIEFCQIVALIPYGRVATYGQIAKLAGLPKHARHVGFALRNTDKDTNLPWHRVVNAQGKICVMTKDNYGQNLQRLKLTEEGVLIVNSRVNLKEYQWKP